jgi:hypothetical protein
MKVIQKWLNSSGATPPPNTPVVRAICARLLHLCDPGQTIDVINEALVLRAIKAWFKAGGTVQPSNDSAAHEVGGLNYVALRNVTGTLAVYRVRTDGALKRLKRWPDALNQH